MKSKNFIHKIALYNFLFTSLISTLLLSSTYKKLMIWGPSNATVGVPFNITVTAYSIDDTTMTAADGNWDYARMALIRFLCTDITARLAGTLTLLNYYESQLNGLAFNNYSVVINTVSGGGDTQLHSITVEDRQALNITPGVLNVTVHKHVDHFSVVLPNNPTAGVPINVTITALNSLNNPALTFNDNITLWLNIGKISDGGAPADSVVILGTNFINGVATVPIIVFGGDPTPSHLNTLFCRSNVVHSGYFAQGNSNPFSVIPQSYANLVLIAPGEQLTPGEVAGTGKDSSSIITQTAGVAFDVKVYTTDSFFNPIGNTTVVTFTSGDPFATLPVGNQSIDTNPTLFALFSPKLGTSGSSQWIKVKDVNTGYENSSNIPVVPGSEVNYTFDSPKPIPDIKTTDILSLTITSRDYYGFKTNYTGSKRIYLKDVSLNDYSNWLSTDIVHFVNGLATLNIQITRNIPQVFFNIDSSNSNIFNVNTGPFTKLLVLFKGEETATPGKAPGKIGTVSAKTANSLVTIKVVAVDDWWNQTSPGVETIANITSPTGYISADLSPPFTGNTEYNVRFRTAYDWDAKAYENQILRVVSSGGKVGESTPVQINPSSYQKLVVILPNEKLDPGTFDATGKIGTLVNAHAGIPFTVHVAATDLYFNPVKTGFPLLTTFYLTLNDPLATLPNGVMSGSVTTSTNAVILTTIGGQTINVTDGSKTGSASLNVIHGPLDHFSFSTINSTQNVGVPFTVTLTAEDKYNHTVLDFNQITQVTINGDDGLFPSGSFVPSSFNFVNGSWSGDFCIYRADRNTRISTNYNSFFSTSNLFNVLEGSYSGIVLKLGNQTYIEGIPNSKTGTVSTIVGTPVQFTVDAVDKYWNRVNAQPWINLSASNYVVFTKNNFQLPTNGTDWGQFIVRTSSNIIITAQDINNGYSSVSTILADPSDFVRLQILAPGEIPVPGGYEVNGKVGNVSTQRTSEIFEIKVRAVDQYWNVVSTFGNTVRLTSSDGSLDFSNPPNQDAPFVNGEVTFPIFLTQQGYIDVTASCPKDLVKIPQTVTIKVEKGFEYVISVPTRTNTSTFFPMNITLIDPLTSTTAMVNTNINLSAINATLGIIGNGELAVKNINLSSGLVVISQRYDFVEKIRIKIVDENRRVGISDVIDVQPTFLKYKVLVSTPVIAGPPDKFNVSVGLYDVLAATENLVATMDRKIFFTVMDPGYIIPSTGTGIIGVASANLNSGICKVEQTYTKSGQAFIKIDDEYGVTGQSDVFWVFPGLPSKLEISAPYFIDSGSSSMITATLTDSYSNCISNKEVMFSILSGPGTVDTIGPVITNILGQAAVNVRAYGNDGGIIVLRVSHLNITKEVKIIVYGPPITIVEVPSIYMPNGDAIDAKLDTPITLTSKSQSGVAAIYYRINGGSWKLYTGPFTPKDENIGVGVHYLEYYAVDVRGLIENVNTSKKIFISADATELVNFPNPFRAGKECTFIEYKLDNPSNVILEIYDLLGQPVWRKEIIAGEDGGRSDRINRVIWDGRNSGGYVIGNGGYILRIWVENEKKYLTRKISVVK